MRAGQGLLPQLQASQPACLRATAGLIYPVGRCKAGLACGTVDHRKQCARRNVAMAWTTPTLVEICIGLEINGYLPAEI
jgi:coenzyme PQQ precursor peptide PqqA